MGLKKNNMPLKKQANRKPSTKQRNIMERQIKERTAKKEERIAKEEAIWTKIAKDNQNKPTVGKTSDARRALALIPIQIVPKKKNESNRQAKQRLREYVLAD